jgi:hypothetical protein
MFKHNYHGWPNYSTWNAYTCLVNNEFYYPLATMALKQADRLDLIKSLASAAIPLNELEGYQPDQVDFNLIIERLSEDV